MSTIQELFELLGLDDKPDPWGYLDGLIHNSNLSEEVKKEMEYYNNDKTEPEILEMMIRLLYDSQPNPVTHGRGYNQTDIKRHLERL